MPAFETLLRETLLVSASLCLPVLAVSTIVGTLVAIVQAATQVQEQTLALLPKLVVVAVMVAVYGAFGMRTCADLFTHVVQTIPQLVTQ